MRVGKPLFTRKQTQLRKLLTETIAVRLTLDECRALFELAHRAYRTVSFSVCVPPVATVPIRANPNLCSLQGSIRSTDWNPLHEACASRIGNSRAESRIRQRCTAPDV